MARKLTLLGMVVAALAALVVPAAASAKPTLFNQTTGVAVAKGSKLMGTNVGPILTTTTKFGTLTCNNVSIGAELTENSGTSIKAESVNKETNSATTCKTSAGPTLTIDNPTLVSLVTNSTTTDEGTIALSYEATAGAATCKFSGSGPFSYVTGTGNDTIKIPPVGKKFLLSGPELCLEEGMSPEFEGEFTLEVDTGGKGTGPMDPVYVG